MAKPIRRIFVVLDLKEVDAGLFDSDLSEIATSLGVRLSYVEDVTVYERPEDIIADIEDGTLKPI